MRGTKAKAQRRAGIRHTHEPRVAGEISIRPCRQCGKRVVLSRGADYCSFACSDRAARGAKRVILPSGEPYREG